jgi:hypothetical protein
MFGLMGDSVAAEKLELLVEGLQKIFRSQTQGALEPTMELRGRYICAAYFLAKFFKMTGSGNDVAYHFANLASALDGLQDGIVHPVLRAKQLNSRPGDRSDVWRLRVLAATGLECLIRGLDLSRITAAAQVAKDYPALKRLHRERSDQKAAEISEEAALKSSLLSWLDAVKSGELNDSMARGAAQDARNFFEFEAPHFTSDRLVTGGLSLLKSASEQAEKLLVGPPIKGQSQKEGILLRRLPPSQTVALDKWIARQPVKLTRPKAIQQLIKRALASA